MRPYQAPHRSARELAPWPDLRRASSQPVHNRLRTLVSPGRQESDSKFRLRVNRFDESVYYDIVLMNEDHLVNLRLDVGED